MLQEVLPPFSDSRPSDFGPWISFVIRRSSFVIALSPPLPSPKTLYHPLANVSQFLPARTGSQFLRLLCRNHCFRKPLCLRISRRQRFQLSGIFSPRQLARPFRHLDRFCP